MNNIFSNSDVQQYFNTLPPAVQETVIQSGVQITSVDHLKQVVENFQSK
ncbi:MAG: hypothetical protein IJF54_02865 [Clostridia bacterium]|nr:hypothetical protein [Clostridia bacterium]